MRMNPFRYLEWNLVVAAIHNSVSSVVKQMLNCGVTAIGQVEAQVISAEEVLISSDQHFSA